MTLEFEQLFCWGGTPQAQCGCGRVHYVSSGENMNEGELAQLEAKRKQKPQQYIPNDNMSVSITDIFGVIYVWDCPCGWGEKIEKKLWSNRARLIKYFQVRTRRELDELKDDAKSLENL